MDEVHFYEDEECTDESAAMGKADAMGKCAPNRSLDGYQFTSVYGVGNSWWMRSAKYTLEGCKDYIGMTVQRLSPGKCIQMGLMYIKYEYMAFSDDEVKEPDVKEGAPEDLGSFNFNSCKFNKTATDCNGDNKDKSHNRGRESGMGHGKDREHEKDSIEPLRVPRFPFDGPASIMYGSSQGCATYLIRDVLSLSITRSKQCRKRGGYSSGREGCAV